MFKALFCTALIASLLTGCKAAAPVAAPVAPHATYHTLDAGASSATLFGMRVTILNDRIAPPVYDTRFSDRWQSQIQSANSDALTKASYNRVIYQVPDDQALVINQIQGSGSITINGYPINVPQADTHYVFGPGELVVFNFSPTYSRYEDKSRWGIDFRVIDWYNPISISGYTADPAMLGGQAGVKQK